MSLVEDIQSLCDKFQTQAREAFTASGGKVEAYNAHISKATGELMGALLKKFEGLHSLIDQQAKEVSQLKVTVNNQSSAIERLEKKVRSIETRDKRSQMFQVKNNLIIRSSEKPTEIGKFICNTIQEGSDDGKKPPTNVYTLTEIKPKTGNRQDSDDDAQADARSRSIYRAVFKDTHLVRAFWKGLPKTNKVGSGTQISSEIYMQMKIRM